ncbi:hypothetical protein [Paenibacillus sp. FSL L8-0709]|uniref:hypothetical protein n=1 Tax=Paenibacillus sp. FSL L8-0709 TaxID=2975312 RepID=UPI0030FCDDD8
MNHYYIVRANEYERAFAKRAKHGIRFLTGEGKENFIEKVTSDYIYFRTKRSHNPNKISRSKLREAIAYLLSERMVTRVQLQKFSSFNSFLMGYLRLAFSSITRIWRSKQGFLKLFMKATKFHFCGMERSPRDLELTQLHSRTAPGILMSYYHLRDDRNETFKRHLRRLGLKIDILDSGEFSRFRLTKRLEKARLKLTVLKEHTLAWQKQMLLVQQLEVKCSRSIVLSDYCDFILKHQDIITYTINLDVTGNPQQSRLNANYMKSRGINPVEVWHAQSSLDDLDELIRTYESDFLAIGGTVYLSEDERQKVFDEVFSRYPNYPFHILGCSSTALLKHPVFSADSSSPLKGRSYHQLITENGSVCADNLKDGHRWTDEECLAWNIEYCSSFEEAYEGFQTQMIMPPALVRGEQMTLF